MANPYRASCFPELASTGGMLLRGGTTGRYLGDVELGRTVGCRAFEDAEDIWLPHHDDDRVSDDQWPLAVSATRPGTSGSFWFVHRVRPASAQG